MVQFQSNSDLEAQVCRNITVSGRRTSIRMEMVFWSELQRIAEIEKRSVNDLITMIDGRKGTSNLTAALRVFIVCYIRAVREETKPPTGTGTGEPSDESEPEEPKESEEGGKEEDAGPPARRTAGHDPSPAGTASA